MQTSHNVLIIESLSYQPEEMDNHMMRFVGKLETKIKFLCPLTGNNFKTIKITAEGSGYSTNDVLHSAIQNFLSGNVYSKTEFNAKEFNCTPDNSNIHYVSVEMPEPFKTLFEELFDLSKWKMPNFELE